MNEATCTRLVRQRAVCQFEEFHDASTFFPCEYCGQWKADLERHHRQFRSRGGLWVPSNILLLCSTCHNGATRERLWANLAGLNVHTWQTPAEVPVKLWWSDVEVLLDDEGGWTPVKVDKA